jgi:hypothetical protein
MKKLPTFRTQEEEISFWEKHSISEYCHGLPFSEIISDKMLATIIRLAKM